MMTAEQTNAETDKLSETLRQIITIYRGIIVHMMLKMLEQICSRIRVERAQTRWLTLKFWPAFKKAQALRALIF